DSDRWYSQLTELGRRALKLDPTREWISCDGDEDLRGTLPVWSRHFGLGNPVDQLPDLNKPLMVGESGGTYYATPAQLSIFNGDRAYASYAGRSEALAIDVYDNIVKMALPKLAYYSASETAWFGIEHLPFGYHDLTRLPDDRDGVFFGPYKDGKPGMQPERLPPYVATLNPGWDPTLPLYKPLPMFEAEKAALAKGGPQPGPWDHRPKIDAFLPPYVPPVILEVTFIGNRAGGLFNRLSSLGVPFSEPGAVSDLLIVDGDAPDL
ncbi:MAG: beta-galactosidase, partial [Armatimonadota bacterium]|nr:beta-galactosidase [Armatimonadota bacterium]